MKTALIAIICLIIPSVIYADNVPVRLKALKASVRIYSHLNSEVRKMVENFDDATEDDIKKLVKDYESLISYLDTEMQTDPDSDLYQKNVEKLTTSIPLPPEPKPKPEIEPDFTNDLGMDFVYIPPGTFMMGSPEDESGRYGGETLHQVTLTKGFHMQTTEVTQKQWKAVMGSNPSRFKDCDDCPVERVSWNEAQEFIAQMNQRGEGTYRLPTEAEWEYACRAGTDTPFYFGKCLLTDEANYDGNYPLEGCPKGEYRKKAVPVASFSPNAWGLYDMHGNVWEWCQDWFGGYPSRDVADPVGSRNGSNRVLRGGSWFSHARNCRSAYRYYDSPGDRYWSVGLRLVFFLGQQVGKH